MSTTRVVLPRSCFWIVVSVVLLLPPPAGFAADWRYEASAPAGGDASGAADGAPGPATGQHDASAAATDRVSTLAAEVADNPGDTDLIVRLADAYAAANQPAKALAHCLDAALLEPDNVAIRRSCAEYAEWAGDLAESRKQFKRLLELVPDDEQGLLGAARAHGWSGKLRRAADYYHRYLELYPDDPDARIEYAQVRSWQGNFAAALDALEAYRERYGQTDRYLEEKARYLAWANRPRQALEINTPLLAEQPDSYERVYTQAVALAAGQHTDEALREVERLKQLRPDSGETLLLERIVTTPTRSNISAGGRYYNDSDSIEIHSFRIGAELHATTRASLSAGALHETLRADAGSGFDTVDGRRRIRQEQAWIGGAYRFYPAAELSGRIGHGDIRDGGDFTPYEIALGLRPGDSTELSLLRSRDLYALSPRAVALEVMRNHNELAASWRPDHRHVVEATASYDDLSDGNSRQRLVLAPRRAVLRTGEFNADLGVYLDWWGFDRDLPNGYYDPESYQRYAGTLFGYWKISEDSGLSMVGSAGFHKDDEMDDFQLGSDIALELSAGLYKDWMSVLHFDYSDRFQESGSYDGWSVDLSVTRRF